MIQHLAAVRILLENNAKDTLGVPPGLSYSACRAKNALPLGPGSPLR